MPIALIPIIAGIAEAAAGYAAFTVAAGFTLANVLAGAAMVGGAMTAVGAATGDKNLSKIGSIAGAIGGIGSIASLADAASEGTNLFASDAAGNYSNVGGGALASDATQQAATTGNTVGQAAANNATGDVASQAANAVNITPAEKSLIDANTPSSAPGNTDLNTNPTGTAGIPGAPGSPSGPSATPNVTPNVTPTGQQPDYMGTGTTPASGASTTPAAPVSGDKKSLWDTVTESVGKAWDKDPAAVMKTGAGMVQGLASYVAPSPLERAQINEKNAAAARLAWEQQQRANLNSSIHGLGAGGLMSPSVQGAPGAAVPRAGATPLGQPGAINPTPQPVTGAPTQQQPGLLQGAFYG